MTEAERLLTVNDLLFDALADYWNWVKEYTVYTIVTDAVKVNEERLRFVKVEYEQGSRPAIDTTEALAQLQGFYLAQNAAYLAFRNAGLDLSNYLWADNQPYNWSMAIIPGTLTDSGNLPLPSLPDLIVLARNSHPKLQMLRNKTNILEIEKRLKMQYLMPKVSLKANYLNKGYAMPEQITTTLLENNYKVGLDLSMPLFFREARGAYQSAKFKITEIGLQQDQTTLNIENKVKMYFNEFYALRQQINIYEQVYSNNKTLFRGERTRFENGESTLFLLNSRENKLLEASQKLAELKAKWLKSYAAVIWATGDLK
jgi:outer membrane protein TolC